jgi:hypothetical protein
VSNPIINALETVGQRKLAGNAISRNAASLPE